MLLVTIDGCEFAATGPVTSAGVAEEALGEEMGTKGRRRSVS